MIVLSATIFHFTYYPMPTIRASPVVITICHVTLQKYLSHSSLVIYIFPTQLIKLKLGLPIGGRLLNNKPRGPETVNSSQIIFVTLFFGRC
jgi:hypothetical protein